MQLWYLSIALILNLYVLITLCVDSGMSLNGTHAAYGIEPARDDYVSVICDSLMTYFESLPKSTIRRLLNDDRLTDFIDVHQDQVFTQKTLTGENWKLRLTTENIIKRNSSISDL